MTSAQLWAAVKNWQNTFWLHFLLPLKYRIATRLWFIWIQSNIQRFALRLDELLNRKDFEAAEAISGLASFGWGVLLLAPAQTYTLTPSFYALAMLISEPLLGLVMFLMGIVGLTALMANWYYSRRHATFVLFVIWTFLSILFWISNFWATATVVYPLLALAAGWSYLRLRHHPH